MIPSFRHHFFYRFCSVTFVALARFCSNFHHTLTIRHCKFCKKIGAEGSVLQTLCHFVILNAIDFFLRFCSETFVALARCCSDFHHTLTHSHCMFFRKIGAEGSVLQELCHFVILNAYITDM